MTASSPTRQNVMITSVLNDLLPPMTPDSITATPFRMEQRSSISLYNKFIRNVISHISHRTVTTTTWGHRQLTRIRGIVRGVIRRGGTRISANLRDITRYRFTIIRLPMMQGIAAAIFLERSTGDTRLSGADADTPVTDSISPIA